MGCLKVKRNLLTARDLLSYRYVDFADRRSKLKLRSTLIKNGGKYYERNKPG